MKQSVKHLIVFAAIALMAVPALAANDAKKVDKPKEMKHQTVCPVMGDKIDSSSYVDIQGQRVYMCCNMCKKKIKADPDKYFEKAAADGIQFENFQKTCPVSGEKLTDAKSSIYYKGRTVNFCCDKCIATFEKDPEKYLKALDSAPAKTETKTETEHKMDKM